MIVVPLQGTVFGWFSRPQAKSLGLSIVKRLQRNALCKSFWQVRTIVRVWSVSRPRGLRTAGPRQRLCAVGA